MLRYSLEFWILPDQGAPLACARVLVARVGVIAVHAAFLEPRTIRRTVCLAGFHVTAHPVGVRNSALSSPGDRLRAVVGVHHVRRLLARARSGDE